MSVIRAHGVPASATTRIPQRALVGFSIERASLGLPQIGGAAGLSAGLPAIEMPCFAVSSKCEVQRWRRFQIGTSVVLTRAFLDLPVAISLVRRRAVSACDLVLPMSAGPLITPSISALSLDPHALPSALLAAGRLPSPRFSPPAEMLS